MNILVTGAKGFVGSRLVAALKNVRENGHYRHPYLRIGEIYECDKETDPEEIAEFCKQAEFVFHLAGANVAENFTELTEANYGSLTRLLYTLEECKSKAPVMYASTVEACTEGPYEKSDFRLIKRGCEHRVFLYGKEKKLDVCVYRFPQIVGAGAPPGGHGTVATLCDRIAKGLPIEDIFLKEQDRKEDSRKEDNRKERMSDDPVREDQECEELPGEDWICEGALCEVQTDAAQPDEEQTNGGSLKEEMELVFVDDLLEELLNALDGRPHHCEFEDERQETCPYGKFCGVPLTYWTTREELIALLRKFHDTDPKKMEDSLGKENFEKKLYRMYCSYIPGGKKTRRSY